MKILVYGAGVLGSNLANNLYKAGKDVTLLARGNWYETIKNKGLVIDHQFSFKKDISRIKVIDKLEAEDIYDVIFVVMQYTHLEAVIDTLNSNKSKNLVLVGNNFKASYFESLLPDKNVMFAFAQSGGKRESDRVVSFDLKKIRIGQRKENASNENFISQIFADTKYKVIYEDNMEDYLMSHSLYIIPIVFACYYANGNLKTIKNEKDYLSKVVEANKEGYRALLKTGHEILPDEDKDFESEKYYNLCMKFLKLCCATKLGKLCASDHAMSAVSEMNALNKDIVAFFEENNCRYDTWKELMENTKGYLGGCNE